MLIFLECPYLNLVCSPEDVVDLGEIDLDDVDSSDPTSGNVFDIGQLRVGSGRRTYVFDGLPLTQAQLEGA